MIISDDIAIQAQGVSKTYKLYPDMSTRVRDRLGFPVSSKKRALIKDFFALQNIDLTVKRGERVGLIGRNGAGKTTFLKLLIGHIQPNQGKLAVNGSVQAMIHTGIGFHYHFSGRENAVAALTYNGFDADQIARGLEDIQEFTELGDYLDQPLKNYSLGMQSRLQFAISSAVNPDILIVDEMLGAGDAYFMNKSNKRMQKLIDTGCTLLLVSHNTQQVLQFCERGIWLRNGYVFLDGPVRDAVNSYDVYMERETHKRHAGLMPTDSFEKREFSAQENISEFQSVLADGKKVFRWPARKGIKIDSLSIVTSENVSMPKSGRDFLIDMSVRVEKSGSYGCRYMATVWTKKGKRIARIENDIDRFFAEEGDIRSVKIDMSPLKLGEGDYTLSFSIYDMKDYASSAHGQEARFDVVAHALDFSVIADEHPSPAFYLTETHFKKTESTLKKAMV